MRVYILSEATLGPEENIIRVFDSPKAARKHFDAMYGINTKNKWKKLNDNTRRYTPQNSFSHYITEWRVNK